MKKIILMVLWLVGFCVLQAQPPITYVKANASGMGDSWTDACSLEYALSMEFPTPIRRWIWVERGVYLPQGTLVVPDSVELYGGFLGTEIELDQRDYQIAPTVIDAQENYGPVVRLGVSAVLDGFTVQNGRSVHPLNRDGGGVWMDGYSKLENCHLVNNTAAGKGGGVYTKSPVSIINTTFEGNRAKSCDSNIYASCEIDVDMAYNIAPSMRSHPSTATVVVLKDLTAPILSVSVIEGTDVTYQWYSNTIKSNKGGTLIPDATTASYTPSTADVGHLYYYCKIGNVCDTIISDASGAYVIYEIEGSNSAPFDPGVVTFKTDKVWTVTGAVDGTVITQEWSDVVMASGCNKTTFDGGTTGNYNADCRSSSDRALYGDLFSWSAVMNFHDKLCPDSWRVPTKWDFIHLDKALVVNGVHGTGINRTLAAQFIAGSYLDATVWGGDYSGLCTDINDLIPSGMQTSYWTLSTSDPTNANILLLTRMGVLNPEGISEKNYGLSLRCVRDK